MPSHTDERGGHAKAEHATETAAKVAKRVGETIDAKREQVADAVDGAADAVGKQGRRAPEAVRRYSRRAGGTLHEAADYVRQADAAAMGEDAVDTVSAHPVATLLVVGAIVVGGSLLVASLLPEQDQSSEGAESRRPLGLSSAANGLGPKGTETLTRIRDAALSFALARAVDAVDEIWPGFRQHYERA